MPILKSLFIFLLILSASIQAQSFVSATLVGQGSEQDFDYNPRNGQEGWALLNYVINDKGSVEDIIVVDSSGDDIITAAAFRRVNAFQYKPATRDGTNVASHTELFFRLLESRGGKDRTAVSRDYKIKYDKILTLVNAKNFEQASQEIEALDMRGSRNLFEHARTAWLKSMYYFHTQQFNLYTREMRVVTLLKDYLATKTVSAGMSSLFESYIFYNELGKALTLVATMSEFEGVEVSQDVQNELLTRIALKSAGKKIITIKAEILDGGVYHHVISMAQQINIQTVRGELNSYDLRCQNFRKVGDDVNKLLLLFADAYGPTCDLFIMAKLGASFELFYTI
ncbi:hypothetical protein BAE46_06885 [Glaciecola punicea]|uniref:energy transducer TonB n=1 Tax=Glaciecola punicea TaxID=56804 RepID=UPI000872CB69|nr:TonB family protein [Glaciecola punicea]OFA31962.1 hypothetical protein BAE46_06885 [Glaciecola punicea]